MDAVSYAHSTKQAKRIKKFIAEPDSTSGLLSLPKVIEAGESITIPDGRVVVHPNLEINGTLTIENDGELLVPFGGTLVSSDLMHPVDTIDDLRNETGKYKYVYVTGYHTKDDGAFGSNMFVWDEDSTETDNGGTIIKCTTVTAGRYKLKYSGDVNVKWFSDNIETIESNLSNFNINLNGKTVTTTTMPYKNSYYNGNININGKVYVKPKISKNHLWQGLFGTRRSSSFSCKDFRTPCYDGWTIATHTGVNANNFYTVKTNKGIKIFRVAGSVVSDTVSLVANLPKKLSKELIGQGCFIKTKIDKGIGYNGDVFLTINASNYLEQPITNNIGTYTNGNNLIKNIKLEEAENIIPCLISELYEQVAININISFSGSSSENDYVEIEYVGLGLNNFFDVKKVDKDISKKYIASSYADGIQKGSTSVEGSISKVANMATIHTDKVIHTQNIDLDWAISATCYDTLGNDLEMYDANDSVSKHAMIDNLSNKGFTIRNNQDITVGNKVLFHYVAEGVL